MGEQGLSSGMDRREFFRRSIQGGSVAFASIQSITTVAHGQLPPTKPPIIPFCCDSVIDDCIDVPSRCCDHVPGTCALPDCCCVADDEAPGCSCDGGDVPPCGCDGSGVPGCCCDGGEVPGCGCDGGEVPGCCCDGDPPPGCCCNGGSIPECCDEDDGGSCGTV